MTYFTQVSLFPYLLLSVSLIVLRSSFPPSLPPQTAHFPGRSALPDPGVRGRRDRGLGAGDPGGGAAQAVVSRARHRHRAAGHR